MSRSEGSNGLPEAVKDNFLKYGQVSIALKIWGERGNLCTNTA